MGIAAYHRGSLSIRRQIETALRPVEFELMEHLNALPKYADAGTPFDEIRFAYSHGAWWTECPQTGFGYHYKASLNFDILKKSMALQF
jgi:hypothetical protein